MVGSSTSMSASSWGTSRSSSRASSFDPEAKPTGQIKFGLEAAEARKNSFVVMKPDGEAYTLRSAPTQTKEGSKALRETAAKAPATPFSKRPRGAPADPSRQPPGDGPGIDRSDPGCRRRRRAQVRSHGEDDASPVEGGAALRFGVGWIGLVGGSGFERPGGDHPGVEHRDRRRAVRGQARPGRERSGGRRPARCRPRGLRARCGCGGVLRRPRSRGPAWRRRCVGSPMGGRSRGGWQPPSVG